MQQLCSVVHSSIIATIHMLHAAAHDVCTLQACLPYEIASHKGALVVLASSDGTCWLILQRD